MRETFHHYFRPSATAFESMWRTAIFSFDASVLLNIYGYSQETSQALLDFIRDYAERIRLPNQCALEYMRNRPKVLIKQFNNYRSARDAFEKIEKERIQPMREHPHLSPSARKAIESIKDELSQGQKRIEGLFNSDPYAETILTACEGRVGPTPDEAELSRQHSEAARRFKEKIPPGIADQKEKRIPEAYGDYIVWEQLIQLASREKRDVIFVTDDNKDDWWWIQGNWTIGPRPELLSEFASRSGQRTWLYKSDCFLYAARLYLSVQFPDAIIKEVGARLESEHKREEAKQTKLPVSDFEEEDAKKALLNSSVDKSVVGYEAKQKEEAKQAEPTIEAAEETHAEKALPAPGDKPVVDPEGEKT